MNLPLLLRSRVYVIVLFLLYFTVRKVSLSLVLKVLVSVWTYSLFWTVTPLIGWSKYAPEPYNVTCSIEWYGETLADISYVWCCFFFLLVVPLAIMVYSYHGIYKHSSNLRHTAYGNPLPANIHSRFLLELETKVTRVCYICFNLSVYVLILLPATNLPQKGIRQSDSPKFCCSRYDFPRFKILQSWGEGS